MRIVAGRWRGRTLESPAGDTTRPTADRVRQALFDMLMHAPWGGRETVEDAVVLDAFAGSGALGLESLSRGARRAVFVEQDAGALASLRANIRACGAADRATVVAADVLALTRVPRDAPPADLVFLDPPYARGLITPALGRLQAVGLVKPDALIVAETGRSEPPPVSGCLAERTHGAARLTIWRSSDT
ncbi:MAG: 16S rRNA (guanine(966)-N(2))-methyltransferase RsmD [Acetobacteraceae bacterium]